MTRFLAMVVAMAAAFPAAASSPRAYEELDRASSLACLRASGFRDAAFAPEPLRFSDKFGVDARLVTGTYPQSHMKGQQGMVLCLYDRASKQVEVVDAAPWISRKQVWPGSTQKKR
jgi:hypothetical protein